MSHNQPEGLIINYWMDNLFFQRTNRTFPNCFTNLRHLFLFVKLFVNFFEIWKLSPFYHFVNLNLKSFTNLQHFFQSVKLFVKFFFVLTTEYLSFPIGVKSFTNLRHFFQSVKLFVIFFWLWNINICHNSKVIQN